MNTLNILNTEVTETNTFKPRNNMNRLSKYAGYLLLFLLILLWPITHLMIKGTDATVGYLDPNIWLLILISLITFMIMIGLCWWLLQQFWIRLGLPRLESMVLQFKNIPSWQQLGFYWLCFISLLLAAIGVLTAVL